MATISKKRRVFTPEQRLEYLERFGRSGLSQAEFCRQAKIHAATFSIWRRAALPAVPAFAEVQVSAPMAGVMGGAMLHLPCGARLEVAVANDTAWHGLGVLLKTLQS